jgi:hypothetical protein
MDRTDEYAGPQRTWLGLVLAVLLVLVGGYLLLRYSLGLTLPDVAVWPLFVLIPGVALVLRSLSGRPRTYRRRHRRY